MLYYYFMLSKIIFYFFLEPARMHCKGVGWTYWRFISIKILATDSWGSFYTPLVWFKKRVARVSQLLAQGHSVSKWQTISPFLWRVFFSYIILTGKEQQSEKMTFSKSWEYFVSLSVKNCQPYFPTQSQKE